MKPVRVRGGFSVNAWRVLEPAKEGFWGGTGVLESDMAAV